MMDYSDNLSEEDEKPILPDISDSPTPDETNTRNAHSSTVTVTKEIELAGPSCSRTVLQIPEFLWHTDIHKKIRKILKTSISPDELHEFMENYIKTTKRELRTLIPPYKNYFYLASKMSELMFLFKDLYGSSTDSDVFYLKICELLAIYTILELKWAPKEASVKVVAERISLNYDVHLKNLDVSYVLQIFLNINVNMRFKQDKVMDHIFEKYLKKENCIKVKLNDRIYCMYLVAYNLWKSLHETDLNHQKEIVTYANNFMAPKPTLESNKEFAPYLPVYNRRDLDITKYILETGFNNRQIIKALTKKDYSEDQPVTIIDLCNDDDNSTMEVPIVEKTGNILQNLHIDPPLKHETPEVIGTIDLTKDEITNETRSLWLKDFLKSARETQPRNILTNEQPNEIEIISIDDDEEEPQCETTDKLPVQENETLAVKKVQANEEDPKNTLKGTMVVKKSQPNEQDPKNTLKEALIVNQANEEDPKNTLKETLMPDISLTKKSPNEISLFEDNFGRYAEKTYSRKKDNNLSILSTLDTAQKSKNINLSPEDKSVEDESQLNLDTTVDLTSTKNNISTTLSTLDLSEQIENINVNIDDDIQFDLDSTTGLSYYDKPSSISKEQALPSVDCTTSSPHTADNSNIEIETNISKFPDEINQITQIEKDQFNTEKVVHSFNPKKVSFASLPDKHNANPINQCRKLQLERMNSTPSPTPLNSCVQKEQIPPNINPPSISSVDVELPVSVSNSAPTLSLSSVPVTQDTRITCVGSQLTGSISTRPLVVGSPKSKTTVSFCFGPPKSTINPTRPQFFGSPMSTLNSTRPLFFGPQMSTSTRPQFFRSPISTLKTTPSVKLHEPGVSAVLNATAPRGNTSNISAVPQFRCEKNSNNIKQIFHINNHYLNRINQKVEKPKTMSDFDLYLAKLHEKNANKKVRQKKTINVRPLAVNKKPKEKLTDIQILKKFNDIKVSSKIPKVVVERIKETVVITSNKEQFKNKYNFNKPVRVHIQRMSENEIMRSITTKEVLQKNKLLENTIIKDKFNDMKTKSHKINSNIIKLSTKTKIKIVNHPIENQTEIPTISLNSIKARRKTISMPSSSNIINNTEVCKDTIFSTINDSGKLLNSNEKKIVKRKRIDSENQNLLEFIKRKSKEIGNCVVKSSRVEEKVTLLSSIPSNLSNNPSTEKGNNKLSEKEYDVFKNCILIIPIKRLKLDKITQKYDKNLAESNEVNLGNNLETNISLGANINKTFQHKQKSKNISKITNSENVYNGDEEYSTITSNNVSMNKNLDVPIDITSNENESSVNLNVKNVNTCPTNYITSKIVDIKKRKFLRDELDFQCRENEVTPTQESEVSSSLEPKLVGKRGKKRKSSIKDVNDQYSKDFALECDETASNAPTTTTNIEFTKKKRGRRKKTDIFDNSLTIKNREKSNSPKDNNLISTRITTYNPSSSSLTSKSLISKTAAKTYSKNNIISTVFVPPDIEEMIHKDNERNNQEEVVYSSKPFVL